MVQKLIITAIMFTTVCTGCLFVDLITKLIKRVKRRNNQLAQYATMARSLKEYKLQEQALQARLAAAEAEVARRRIDNAWVAECHADSMSDTIRDLNAEISRLKRANDNYKKQIERGRMNEANKH